MEQNFYDCRTGKNHTCVKSQDDTEPRRIETIGEIINWGNDVEGDR